MDNFRKSFRELLGSMMEKPLWLLMVLSIVLTTIPYANRTMLDLPVAVIDMDHSVASRELMRLLDATPKIAVLPYDNLVEARRDLEWRQLFGIIVLPLDFEKRVLRGESVAIPSFGDSTNRTANGQIQLDVAATYAELLLRYNQSQLMRAGFSEPQASALLNPVVGQLTDLFNPGPSFAAIVLPGLVTLVLQHSLLLSCTRSNLNLRGGTPKSLRLPPSTRFGRYTAQLLVWTALCMLFYVIWPWLMGYRQTTAFLPLMCVVLPFLLAVIAMSEFIAELLPSEESVYLTMTFITMPLFYMSGFSWPTQAMPRWIQLFAEAIPSTWAIRAVVEMNQMNLPLSAVVDRILILLGMAAAYGVLGTLIYQYRNWRWDELKGW